MKQKKKRKMNTKVRATHLNELLKSKRSEKHEEKHGHKAKRAKRKEQERKEITADE